MNHQGNIAQAIDGIPRKGLVSQGYEVHVVVMDGRSSDGTLSIARDKGAHTLIQRGNGKGAAVRQAFELCDPRQVVPRVLELSGGLCSKFHDLAAMLDSDYLILLDAEGSYYPQDFLRMLSSLQGGADVVMGSRFLDPAVTRAVSPLDRFRNALLSGAATLLYQQRCTDLCAPLWGFNARSLRKLKLDSKHFELEAELFAESLRKGLKVREIPLSRGPENEEHRGTAFIADIAIVLKLIESRFKDHGRRQPAGPVRVKIMTVHEPATNRSTVPEPIHRSVADQVPLHPGEMT
jgi:dolichol-phosphate mannosyltransferase